jgi:hypothetical protein
MRHKREDSMTSSELICVVILIAILATCNHMAQVVMLECVDENSESVRDLPDVWEAQQSDRP